MQEAVEFYNAMVRELITDMPLDDSKYRPHKYW